MSNKNIKCKINTIFSLKYLVGIKKVRNFAPAFKEQRFLKHLRKSSLIDLHKQIREK
jgi:hypothetical protein